MKKIILYSIMSIFTIFLATTSAVLSYTPTDAEIEAAMKKLDEPYSEARKNSLNSMGWSAIRAFENKNYDAADRYTTKMMLNGAESVTGPDKRKYDPTCPYSQKPEITVNGKTLKGNTCVKLTYVYKGKSYDIGYCK